METLIRRASKQDLSILREFLIKANLGTDGLSEESAEYFLLLENEDGEIVGTLGIETFAEAGLLRSLVVTSNQTENEILLLFGQALKLASEKGITTLYLATNKNEALPLFELFGFRRTKEEDIPEDLHQSKHVQHILNVDNTIFLALNIV